MTGTRCAVFGHRWRFVAAETANGIHWSTWLCRQCPASIQTADPFDPPEGGILTPADLALVTVLAIAAAVIAWLAP